MLFFPCRFFVSPRFAFARRPPSPEEEDALLRPASFFINAEKGRRRPGRSSRSAMLSAEEWYNGGAELCQVRREGTRNVEFNSEWRIWCGADATQRKCSRRSFQRVRGESHRALESLFQSWPWRNLKVNGRVAQKMESGTLVRLSGPASGNWANTAQVTPLPDAKPDKPSKYRYLFFQQKCE